jgi:hypothetical protein
VRHPADVLHVISLAVGDGARVVHVVTQYHAVQVRLSNDVEHVALDIYHGLDVEGVEDAFGKAADTSQVNLCDA